MTVKQIALLRGFFSVLVVLWLLQAAIGVMLLSYYEPRELWYTDVRYLEFDVPHSMLVRTLHRYSTWLVIGASLLFVVMTIVARAAGSRVAIALLILTLVAAISWTGRMLPWDQLAIWAVTVGTNQAREAPMLGHEGPFDEQLRAAMSSTSGEVRYDAKAHLEDGSRIRTPVRPLRRFRMIHGFVLPGATLLALVFTGVLLWRRT